GGWLRPGRRLGFRALEPVDLARVANALPAPEPAHHGDALLEPPRALAGCDPEVAVLAALLRVGAAAADARAEDRAPLREHVEARPLVGEEQRGARGERRHAGDAELHAARARGDRPQERPPLQPR